MKQSLKLRLFFKYSSYKYDTKGLSPPVGGWNNSHYHAQTVLQSLTTRNIKKILKPIDK